MNIKIQRAIISVFDKSNITDFARSLADMGVEILSSGGTARHMAEAGIEVTPLENWTGFPEMLGHRVVTLHPKVHGAILALRDDQSHIEDMEKFDIQPVDLVCVNLYPFEKVLASGASKAEVIEMIDIGGPTMVRGAAKNHRFVTVVTEPEQYDSVINEMQNSDGCVSEALRTELALSAFSRTAQYDSAISNYLADQQEISMPDKLTLSYDKVSDLRYGENPHQVAAVYRSSDTAEACVAQSDLLGGREISFNNYYDANGAYELIKEFDRPAVAVIKHANPAGCAIDDNLVEAYKRAYLADVNAALGSIIATNRKVTLELAEAIAFSYQNWGKACGAGGFYAEVIIAPDFEDGVREMLIEKKTWGANVRLLRSGELTGSRNSERFMKYIVGGLLVQQRDLCGLNTDAWKCVTSRQPSEQEMEDLKFAWLCCKHVKSNAIVLAKDLTLLGAGAGQMSRVNSSRMAVHLAKQYGGNGSVELAGSAVASDAFFPFPDGLDVAADIGATSVIQPGGSKKDADVIARADELGISMIMTSTRHFNH